MKGREFVSYPKSGRTWIRFALEQIGCGSDIRFHHDGFEFNDGIRLPHNFDIAVRLDCYRRGDKVIYLERDPRDIMVSLFHQITGRFRDYFGYQGTISDFIRDDYFGAQSLHRFRTMWEEIVASNEFLKLSYEQCHRNLGQVLHQIADYYEIGISADDIQQAVVKASFAEMKKVEESGSFTKAWLRKRNDAPKVRRGIVGGYRDELCPADIAYLETVFGIKDCT